MAGGTIEANGDGAVIDVLTAVISRPTVDADTGMSPDGVEASAPIMAGIWLHETLVDILSTVLPWCDEMTYWLVRTHHEMYTFKVDFKQYVNRSVPVHSGGHWQL